MISPVWFELESRLLCGSIGMFFVCLMPAIRFSRNVLRAVLSKCLAFVLRQYVPLEMSRVRSRLLFDAERQTERLAGCSVPVPPWVVIAGSAFSNRWCGYRISLVHFGLARFLAAIPTENEGDEETRRTKGRGERSRRRGKVRFA